MDRERLAFVVLSAATTREMDQLMVDEDMEPLEQLTVI